MSNQAPSIASFPAALTAPGSASAPFVGLLPATDLALGAMRRISLGDLDLLVAYTANGIVVVDDRCPHMSAPLSVGQLEGCIVACPLHEGRFDLCTGDPVQMPTTGGLDADGRYHPTWTPGGREGKPDVPGKKAEARSLTRIRRFRYYPVRVANDVIEAAIPVG